MAVAPCNSAGCCAAAAAAAACSRAAPRLDPRAIRTSFSSLPSLPTQLSSAPLAPSYIKPSCSHVALRCRHRCRSYLSLPPPFLLLLPLLPFASTNRLCLAEAVRILSAEPERERSGRGAEQSRQQRRRRWRWRRRRRRRQQL